MRQRDHYEVLGVSRDAPGLEIRRAYRRLARRYSPDVNLWDDRAAGLFEEIAEAYRVLGDPAARALYDRLGHRAFGVSLGEAGGHLADAVRGEDLHYALDLDLEEAIRGVEATIGVTRREPCPGCASAGDVGRRAAERCRDCEGRGVRLAPEGELSAPLRCPACRGTGWSEWPACRACGSRGTVPVSRRLAVTIPPGVDTGAQVRLPGEGHAPAEPGPRGDLVVVTRVRAHPFFLRKGDHLACEVPVTVPEAALGARIPVPTPDGPMMLTMPAGTQSGQVFRIRGRGCPRLGRDGRGDVLVTVRVVIPRNPDSTLEEVLRALERLLPDNPRADLLAGARLWSGHADPAR